MTNVLDILDQHHPSMTDQDEQRIIRKAYATIMPGHESDPADFAIRTCSCGYAIDGFDDYVYHLKTKIQESIE